MSNVPTTPPRTITVRTPTAPQRRRRSAKECELWQREFLEEIYEPPGPKNLYPKTQEEKRQFINEVMIKLLSPRNKRRGWDQVFSKEETLKVGFWLHKKNTDMITKDDIMYFTWANNGPCGILCLKAHICGDFSFDHNFKTI
jgi:hypothetical protein